jgi:hypothetical protein
MARRATLNAPAVAERQATSIAGYAVRDRGSRVRVSSPAPVHATTINAAPADTDLTRLPWDQQTGLNLVNVAVTKLVFPPIPALQDYLTKS